LRPRKDEMPLSERVFRCEACGVVIDRDLNAARNLATVAGSSPETLHACGGEGAGQGSVLVTPVPATQETSRRKRAASAVGNKRP
jgi:putative transposase